MSKVQMLRSLVKQRLTAAAEEIFGLFERTMAEYEEELSRSKEENERQRKLLDAVLNPQLQLHRADVQQLLVVKGEVPPEQQEWSSSVDQEDPEPPHIKEEQEELRSSQEGEQLQGQEEADITKFTFTPVTVKSEDEEEKPQSSQLHQGHTEQIKTEADGEDCGGPEASRNSDPHRHLQPETDDSDDDWKETREPQSGSNSLRNDEVPVGDSRCSAEEKPFSCSVYGKIFGLKTHLKRHRRSHTGEKPFSCSVCMRSFTQRIDLERHMRTHTGEKPFSCSVCMSCFAQKANLERHMRMHTGEKPFSCSICMSSFTQRIDLERHMRTHTGEKPFSCSVCGQRFTWPRQLKNHQCVGCQSSQLHQKQTEQIKTEADGEDCGGPEASRNSDPDRHLQPETDDKTGDSSEPETDDSHDWKDTREYQSGLKSLKIDKVPVGDLRCSGVEKTFSCSECGKIFGQSGKLSRHMRYHTGKKPFSCSVCKISFIHNAELQKHMRTHTGEKPFSCSVCTSSFTQRGNLERHMRTHTGEKPFSCSVCGQRFGRKTHLQEHMIIHTGEKAFSCSECGREFSLMTYLKKHMRSHRGEKPFSCSVCGKRFPRNESLVLHMNTHTGEKPFSCSVCGQRFTWPSQLKNHHCFGFQSSQPHQTLN